MFDSRSRSTVCCGVRLRTHGNGSRLGAFYGNSLPFFGDKRSEDGDGAEGTDDTAVKLFEVFHQRVRHAKIVHKSGGEQLQCSEDLRS